MSKSAKAPVTCIWCALRVSASQVVLVNALEVSGIYEEPQPNKKADER